MSKAAVKQITDSIGAEKLQRELGVSLYAIRFVRSSGVMPASWFDRVDALCREAGIDCPRSVFNWRSKEVVRNKSSNKGAAA